MERALAACAQAGRFGEGDLAAILSHQEDGATVIPFRAKAAVEEHTLQRSTRFVGGVRAMSNYHEAQIQLDADRLEDYPNGIRVQEIQLVFTDDPELPSWRAAEPVICAIDARRAREFAFELLMAAEVAEHWEKAR